MKVSVVDYNSKWQGMFFDEAKQVASILGDSLLQIFHIGSTSVVGQKAKPIIDMMPVVSDIEIVDLCRGAFERLGYEYMGEFGIPGRRYMHKGGEKRTHQIHVYQYDNVKDVIRHLAFRDYLSCHVDVRNAYGDIKEKLALKHPEDSEAYCGGKDNFVKQVEREALQWYWKKYNIRGHCGPLKLETHKPF